MTQLAFPFTYLMNIEKYIQVVGYEGAIISLHPIFLMNYVKCLINKKYSKKSLFISFIPAVLVTLSMIPFLMIDDQTKIKFLSEELKIPGSLYPGIILSVACIVYFTVRSYMILYHHKNHVLHVYSYRENIDLLWLRRIIIAFTIVACSSLILASVLYLAGIQIVYSDFLFYTALSGFVFFIGYWGYRQGHIFTYQVETVVADKTFEKQKSSNAKTFSAEEANKIKVFMEKEKPYLNPALTIHDLSEKIELPVYQLSKTINKAFHKNFFEFVNSYRIDEFKTKVCLKEFKNYTILGIALECGFNSKSAFNRIFKEQTGFTPGEFRKINQC